MVAFSGAFMYNMPCYPKEKRRKAREEREALRLIWIVMAAVAVCLYLLLLSPALSKRGKEALFGSRWYAHRGLHDGNLCENTLRAFEKAAKSGYGIELDVRLTKDDQLIVFHDDTLKRLCSREEAIRDMTLEQVKQVQLPDGQEIPALKEVLQLVNGSVPMLVEIKSHRIGDCKVSERLYELLKEYCCPYTVQSFDPFQLRWFKKHAPDVIRGQLAQKARLKKPFRLNYLPQLMAGQLLFNRISVPDYVAYRQEDTKRFCYRMMRRVYRTGLAVWTVRSEAEAEKMKDICDVIIFENFCPPNKGGINHERSA